MGSEGGTLATVVIVCIGLISVIVGYCSANLLAMSSKNSYRLFI